VATVESSRAKKACQRRKGQTVSHPVPSWLEIPGLLGRSQRVQLKAVVIVLLVTEFSVDRKSEQ
jgi:hypothetical protein